MSFMIKNLASPEARGEPDPGIVQTYKARLQALGYSSGLTGKCIRTSLHLIAWLSANGTGIETLDVRVLHHFLNHDCACPGPRGYHKNPERGRWHLHRFLGFLMETGHVRMPAEIENGARVVESFLQTLMAQGYVPESIAAYRKRCRHFIVWLYLHDVALAEVDDDVFSRFLLHDCTCAHPHFFIRTGRFAGRNNSRSKIGSFIEYLIGTGIAPPRPTPACEEPGHYLARFLVWLRRYRGIGERTIQSYHKAMRVLLPHLGDDPGRYSATLIRNTVRCRPDRRYAPRCGRCHEPAPYRDTRRIRHFRHVPIWGVAVALRYAPRRVSCSRCAGVRVESMPWVSGKQRMTRALVVTLATWARVLAWEQVARLFHCAWGTVATAVDEAVAYGLAHRDLEGVTHIGIDEISRKRGHVYVTNVYDLQDKRLLWSGEGRSKATLEAFFEFLGPEKTAAIEGICCDMWQPYIEVVKDRAPQAVLVFDKFHIVRHLMAALDQVRRDEIREKGPQHKALMHKTRFIWLKNPSNLTERQAHRLGELQRLNLKINRAYLLKELFRHFWEYRRGGWAKRYLKKWFWWATHSRLEPMRDFAWMLRRHEEGILNYFRVPIDNGTVEGLNNKAKLVIHKAYGFRTANNYIRNLYHCLGNLPLPQTVHTFV